MRPYKLSAHPRGLVLFVRNRHSKEYQMKINATYDAGISVVDEIKSVFEVNKSAP